jgi:hypothetical protein
MNDVTFSLSGLLSYPALMVVGIVAGAVVWRKMHR